MSRLKQVLTLGLMGSVALATGCGKKKSSSSGVSAATSVDEGAVTASTESLALASGLSLLSASSTATSLRLTDFGGDYAKDQTNFQVRDPSMEALSSVGSILCFLDQTGYNHEKVVNAGKYVAQVNMKSCDSDRGGGDSGSSSGASGSQTEMVNVTVESERPENKPLSVKMWFDMNNGGGGGSASRLSILLKIAEGVSTSNPYGIFRLAFKGFAIDSKTGKVADTASQSGVLEAKRASVDGDVLMSFVENGASTRETFRTQLAVQATLDDDKVTKGIANIDQYSKYVDNGKDFESKKQFKLSFDDNYFFANNGVKSEQVCRNQKDFLTNVYRYGAYTASNGNRLSFSNPSFPVVYKKADGSKLQGNASYNGIWIEGDLEMKSGDTLYKDNFGDKSAAEVKYTVATAAGKLIKNTRVDTTLAAVDGVEMTAGSNDGKNYRVAYSKSKGYFESTASSSNGSGMMTWTEFAAKKFELRPNMNNFWSQALGGMVTVLADSSGALTSSSPIFYYKSENVTATAGTMNLNCYQQCFKANLSTAEMTMIPGQFGYSGWISDASAINSPNVYSYDGTNMKLNYNGSAVAPATGASAPDMGVRSGALVDDTVKAALIAAGKSVNEVNSASVFYTWEFGPKAWHKFVGLKDSAGKFVTFDPPRLISYTHTKAFDGAGQATSNYFDKKLAFNWTGDGRLDIPGVMDSETGYWKPRFSIKSGALAGDNKEFVFKALDGELYMAKVDNSKCSGAGLNFDSIPELPALDTFKDEYANNDAKPDSSSLATLVVEGAYVGK